MTSKYIPELAKTITSNKVNIMNGKSFYIFFDEYSDIIPGFTY
jgi:hypothetical protein